MKQAPVVLPIGVIYIKVLPKDGGGMEIQVDLANLSYEQVLPILEKAVDLARATLQQPQIVRPKQVLPKGLPT